MPRARAGMAASVPSTSRQVGAALGVAVIRAAVAAGSHGSAWWIVTGCGAAALLRALLTAGRRARAAAIRGRVVPRPPAAGRPELPAEGGC